MSSTPQKSLPHRRKEIRHKVRDLLRQYVDVSDRVFVSRPNPVFLTELPCILVYFSDESIDNKNSEPRYLTRTLNLNVDILHSDRSNIAGDENDELDDYLDSRSFEVEYALLHDRYLEFGAEAGWFHKIDLQSVSAVEIIFEGEQVVAALRLTFQVTYETEAFVDGTLDEFLKFRADYNTTTGEEASDFVNIRSS